MRLRSVKISKIFIHVLIIFLIELLISNRGHKRLFSKTINKQRRIQANKTQSQGGRPSIKRNGLKDQMKIQEKFRFK